MLSFGDALCIYITYFESWPNYMTLQDSLADIQGYGRELK